MGKIYSLLFIIVLILCSCERECAESAVSGDKMVTIRLSTEDAPEIVGQASTRTELKNDNRIEWHNGDCVFIVSGGRTYDLVNVNADGPEALFEGEVPESWLNSYKKMVFYSSDAVRFGREQGFEIEAITRAGFFSGIDNILLPSEQPLMSGTFARGYNYSVASFTFTESTSLYFMNIGGCISMDLTGNVTVKSIKITAPEKMNGIMGVETVGYGREQSISVLDFREQDPISSSTVTLTSADGITLTEEAQSFYACAVPFEGGGEYTIVVETEQGMLFTKTVTKEEGLASGEILSLGEFDITYTFYDIDGSTVDLDPVGKETVSFPLPSGAAPVVSALPDWLHFSVEGNMIVFDPDMNISGTVRSGKVTASQGSATATVTFRQESVSVTDIRTYGFDSDAAVSDEIMLKDYFVEAVSGWDVQGNEWITPVKGTNSFTVSVTENLSGEVRTGTVEITDGKGTVVSTLSVTQTVFNDEDLPGRYTFHFTDMNKKDNGWRLIFSRCPGAEDGFAVNAIKMDGTDLSAYCPDIRVDYVSRGVDGPLLRLVGPQYFAGSGLCLQAAAKDGSGAEGDGVGYDLIYAGKDGKIRFDFIPNAAARLAYPAGLSGLWIYNISDGSAWEVMNPLKNTDCLSITKWGDNHEGFLPN